MTRLTLMLTAWLGVASKLALAVSGVALMTLPSFAQTNNTTEPDQSGHRFETLLGYRYIPLDYVFDHNTHPDDSFLPNANIAGSAGRTKLNVGNFVALGVASTWRGKSISSNLDGGILLGGNRDGRKNANDSRPDANGAFIFSQASLGGFGAAGVSYHIKKFSFGGEGQLSAIFIQSGWDRFSKDQTQTSTTKTFPSAGPKIGYTFDDTVSFEGTVQFGRATTVGLNLRYRF